MNPCRSSFPELITLFGCGLFCVLLQSDLSASTGDAAERDRGALGSTESHTQVECIMPDGRLVRVSQADQNAPATVKDDAISCALREGETVFIIAFPRTGVLDRLTFVNKNSAACGELKIAVSNYHLRADSPAWTDVDGAISFARKRLFNLSMIGVEAKYVKLSFHVQKSEKMTGISIDPRRLRLAATVAAN